MTIGQRSEASFGMPRPPRRIRWVGSVTSFFFLYFTACMVNAPDTCDSKRMPLDVATPRGCLRVAQPQLAVWVEAHPQYRIRAFRCGAPVGDIGPGTRI